MKRTTNVDYKATASAKGRAISTHTQAIVHTAQYASERTSAQAHVHLDMDIIKRRCVRASVYLLTLIRNRTGKM